MVLNILLAMQIMIILDLYPLLYQQTPTCSKLEIEAQEQVVKIVQD